MLRFNDVNLKLISETETYQFVESMIRGVISIISKSHAESNNKFSKSHDASKPTLYIIYLDLNILYGHLMKQIILTEIIDWVNPKDFNVDNWRLKQSF